LAADGDPSHQSEVFAHTSRLGVMLALLVTIPTLLITPLAISLIFGSAFTSATPSALLLVFGGALIGINYILSEALLGLSRTGGPVRAQFLGLIATGATLAVLLPLLGILGAALSSVIGYGTTAAWLLVEARSAIDTPIHSLLIPSRHEMAELRSMLGRR
jgi:O-antigen/teichoic acid export membrane protein